MRVIVFASLIFFASGCNSKTVCCNDSDSASLLLNIDSEVYSDRAFTLTNNMTVACWARLQKGGGEFGRYQMIISQWQPGRQKFTLGEHMDTGKLRAYVDEHGDGTSQKWYWSKNEVFDDEWRMYGFSFKDGDLKIIVDGAYVEMNKGRDAEMTSLYDNQVDVLNLGGHMRPSTYRMHGMIDQCSAWHVAMDARGVADLFKKGRIGNLKKHRNKKQLVHYWPVGFSNFIDDIVGGNHFNVVKGTGVLNDGE